MADLAQLLKLPTDIYEKTICKYLSPDIGPSKLADIPKCSLIACTARSGSTLLQISLESYGIDPQEWFNPEGAMKRAFDAGDAKTLREYADLLAAKTKEDRFDLKGPTAALLYLYRMCELPERRANWRVVFLRRKNLIQQAISQRIVSKTGQWTSKMDSRAAVTDEDYSYDDIMRAVMAISAQNDIWEKAFIFLGLNPLRIFYENFRLDVAGNAKKVAEYIGVDVERYPDANNKKPRLESQFTELNDRWEKRFRKELSRSLIAR